MAWTLKNRNSANWGANAKNSASWTNASKGSVTSNLWDESNTPWDNDTYKPWQDEGTIVNTAWTNLNRN